VEDEPVREFVLYEDNFGWMDVWELNPEGVGSIRMTPFAIGGGGESLWVTASFGGNGPCPIFF
jgi:hypothetical protein